ncbi:MAG TPA: YcaO-like family protein, partial [Herpetosiphonaceae bacterium]
MAEIGSTPDLAIRYRDYSYALHKRYTHGNSDRTLLPEETLDKIKPHFPSIGLTRLGNITGLDRAGIPVTVAIRPNSYSLTQSSGKGTSLIAALTSAAMESIELYCAENIRQKRMIASYSEVKTQFQTIDLHKIHFSRHSLFHVDRPEEWLIGWDIAQQREVAVPYHSVTLDFR